MYLTHNSATTQYIHERVHVALMMVIKQSRRNNNKYGFFLQKCLEDSCSEEAIPPNKAQKIEVFWKQRQKLGRIVNLWNQNP